MPGCSEIVTSEPATDGDSNILRWLGIALATFAATIAMGAVGLPTPALFAALLIGITYALIAVRRPLDVPSSGITIGQALIGVALGAELDASTLRAVASNWFGVSAVTLATLALSLGVGIGIARLTGISQATGTLGLIAGGASGIVAMADELGADSRLVAFMQYVRVLVVVLVAPLVAYILLAHGESGVPQTEPIGTGLVADLAFTGGCALAGALVARRLRVTAGTLLCPLAVAAILSVSGIAGDASVPALAQSLAFALIGLQVGLRFTVATISRSAGAAPVGARGDLRAHRRQRRPRCATRPARTRHLRRRLPRNDSGRSLRGACGSGRYRCEHNVRRLRAGATRLHHGRSRAASRPDRRALGQRPERLSSALGASAESGVPAAARKLDRLGEVARVVVALHVRRPA